MKLSFGASLFALGLAVTGEAARIEQEWTSGPWNLPGASTTYYGDDGKKYPIRGSFDDGCKGTQYDWIKQMCIDQNRKRAHVTYSGGSRNCFVANKRTQKRCGGDEGCWMDKCQYCHHWIYEKTKCTW